jgi:hypothetical protein
MEISSTIVGDGGLDVPPTFNKCFGGAPFLRNGYEPFPTVVDTTKNRVPMRGALFYNSIQNQRTRFLEGKPSRNDKLGYDVLSGGRMQYAPTVVDEILRERAERF